MYKLKVFALIFLFALKSCKAQNRAQESIVLLPENFQGPVAIIFDQKEGVIPKIENGKYVYEIPESGILRTTVHANLHVLGHEYYYVNKKGKRTSIQYLESKGYEKVEGTMSDKQLDINKSYAFGEEMSGLLDGSRVRLFAIGKPKDFELLGQQKDKLLFRLE